MPPFALFGHILYGRGPPHRDFADRRAVTIADQASRKISLLNRSEP